MLDRSGSPLFSDDSLGNYSDGDDEGDGPAFIGFDGGNDRNTTAIGDGFGYITPTPSEPGDEEYDAAYARQTHEALKAMIDEADAALFGESAADDPNTPAHVAECHSWHRSLGCLRVRGVASTSGTSASAPMLGAGRLGDGEADGASDASLGDGYSSDGADPAAAVLCGRPASQVVSADEHCVLAAALPSTSLQLCVSGTTIVTPPVEPLSASSAGSSTTVAPEDDGEEEIYASHGVLSESIEAHHDNQDGIREHDGGGGESSRGHRSARARTRLHSEQWVASHLGLPPREPSLAMRTGALDLLLAKCWQRVVSHLAELPMLVARHVLGVGTAGRPPTAASQQEQQQQPQQPQSMQPRPSSSSYLPNYPSQQPAMMMTRPLITTPPPQPSLCAPSHGKAGHAPPRTKQQQPPAVDLPIGCGVPFMGAAPQHLRTVSAGGALSGQRRPQPNPQAQQQPQRAGVASSSSSSSRQPCAASGTACMPTSARTPQGGPSANVFAARHESPPAGVPPAQRPGVGAAGPAPAAGVRLPTIGGSRGRSAYRK